METAKVQIKPKATLYHLPTGCKQSDEFRKYWDAQKSFNSDIEWVEVDCSGGFPEGISWVPTVRFEAGVMELRGIIDLKSYFYPVLHAMTPSQKFLEDGRCDKCLTSD